MAKLMLTSGLLSKEEFSQRRNLASRLEHRNLFELTVLGAPVVFERCLFERFLYLRNITAYLERQTSHGQAGRSRAKQQGCRVSDTQFL